MTDQTPLPGIDPGLPADHIALKDLPRAFKKLDLTSVNCDASNIVHLANHVTDDLQMLGEWGSADATFRNQFSGIVWVLNEACEALAWKLEHLDRNYILLPKGQWAWAIGDETGPTAPAPARPDQPVRADLDGVLADACRVADFLRAASRMSDLMGRESGPVFACIESALEIAERLRRAIDEISSGVQRAA